MPESELLFRFQLQGDLEALVAFGKSLGYSEAGLRAAIDVLRTIFESLSLGKQPQYDRVDRQRLLEHRHDAFFIIRMMSGSHSVGVKTAGLHLMGVLNSEPFIDDLRKALASDQDWERIESLRALARMSHPRVRAILEAATSHPDPPTRRAAHEALERFEK